MEQFFSKLFEFLESIVRPRQLMFLLAVISGFALFGPDWLISVLQAKEGVAAYRFWILLIFLVAAGLQLMGILLGLYEWFGRCASHIKSNWKYSHLKLSLEARLILQLLRTHLPDPVRLVTSKRPVRELRVLGLIQCGWDILVVDEVQRFSLTSGGIIAARAVEASDFDSLSEEQKLELLRDFTGANIAARGPYG